MSDEPPFEVTRPATARPRGGVVPSADEEPPTEEELAAIEHGLVELPRYSGAVVREIPELGVSLAILHGRGPGYNFAGSIRWPEPEVGDRLGRLEELMRAEQEWPALIVAEGVSAPASIATDLTAAGWVEIERERVLWTRLAPGVPHLDPRLRIEAVTSRSTADYERVEREIFGLGDDFESQRIAGLSYSVSAGWLRAYLVRLDGEAVATARLAAGDGVAGIFGVGVLPAHRRRGLASLVTAVATRAGFASGNRLVWLSVNELNDAAMAVYRRLGYQPAFSWSRWVVSAI